MDRYLTNQDLWAIKAIDTHCHHLQEGAFNNITLHQLMQMTYISWILPDQGDTVEGHRAYFDRMAANSYFRWWRKSIEILYGDGRKLTPESWDWYNMRVREAYQSPGHDIDVLVNQCQYDNILLDDYKAPGHNHGHPELMRPIFRCDMFLSGYADGKTDENQNSSYQYFNKHPETLGEYVDQTQKAIQNAVSSGSVGLKIAIAYERSLEFQPDMEQIAKQAFGRQDASFTEQKAFGDYMMFRIAEIAGEIGVPIQIHTGLGKLSGSRAIGLRDLIDANPKTKFDVFHASYPWCADVLGLAHNYRNVWIDLCWVPLISTYKAGEFLHEALELIDENRVVWGCDTWTSEESFGARLAAHECLMKVLNGFMEEGVLDIRDAKRISKEILHDNAADLFNLQ